MKKTPLKPEEDDDASKDEGFDVTSPSTWFSGVLGDTKKEINSAAKDTLKDMGWGQWLKEAFQTYIINPLWQMWDSKGFAVRQAVNAGSSADIIEAALIEPLKSLGDLGEKDGLSSSLATDISKIVASATLDENGRVAAGKEIHKLVQDKVSAKLKARFGSGSESDISAVSNDVANSVQKGAEEYLNVANDAKVKSKSKSATVAELKQSIESKDLQFSDLTPEGQQGLTNLKGVVVAQEKSANELKAAGEKLLNDIVTDLRIPEDANDTKRKEAMALVDQLVKNKGIEPAKVEQITAALGTDGWDKILKNHAGAAKITIENDCVMVTDKTGPHPFPASVPSASVSAAERAK